MRRICAGVVVGVIISVASAGAHAAEIVSKVHRIYTETAKGLNRIAVHFTEKTGCNVWGKPDPNGSTVMLNYGNAETKYMMAILTMAKAAGKKVVFEVDPGTCEFKTLSPAD